MQKYSVGIFADGSVSVIDDTNQASVFHSFREQIPLQTSRAYKNEQLACALAALLREEMSRLPVPEPVI